MSTLAPVRPGSPARAIGLVSTAHFFSHFYMLLLPPLFPLLKDVYGVGYTELGLALTVMSVTTAFTQAPVGFLVDRIGARGILIAGLILESICFVLIGVFPTYGALLALMAVIGIANSVYHPADYAILNASVDERRMGRAFSIHTTAGYVGDALAPVTIVALASLAGWQVGMVACGVFGLVMAAALLANSGALQDGAARDHRDAAQPAGGRAGLGLLFSLPIMMGLLFYVGITFTGTSVSKFSVSVLNLTHGAPVAELGVILSCYLFASPVGVLVGGWIADRNTRHDLVAAACFVIIALAIFAVAAFQPPLAVIGLLFVVAGFFNGVVSPSRDMLIRSLTPPGQMGKVFGFVSTGFNVGGMIAPPLFGYVLDHGDPLMVFWIGGAVSLLTVVTVLATGRQGRKNA